MAESSSESQGDGIEPVAVSLDGAVYAVAGYVEVDETFAPRKHETVDAHSFIAAMARLASGVVMVTTTVEGRPWGLTVSACCSISVDPPLILVSLNRRTESAKAIRTKRMFGVSVLRDDQRELAQRGAAAGQPKFVDDFCQPDPETPSPAISRALYHLDCTVEGDHDAGTHALLIGRVRRVIPGDLEDMDTPLLYFNRRFHQLGKAVS